MTSARCQNVHRKFHSKTQGGPWKWGHPCAETVALKLGRVQQGEIKELICVDVEGKNEFQSRKRFLRVSYHWRVGKHLPHLKATWRECFYSLLILNLKSLFPDSVVLPPLLASDISLNAQTALASSFQEHNYICTKCAIMWDNKSVELIVKVGRMKTDCFARQTRTLTAAVALLCCDSGLNCCWMKPCSWWLRCQDSPAN